MKVYFDAPEASATETGERVEQFGPVVFLGKEEGMLRRPSVCVGKAFRKSWVAADPRGDACTFDVAVRRAVGGFEVIGDAEEDVGRPTVAPVAKEPLDLRTEQGRQPELSVSGE